LCLGFTRASPKPLNVYIYFSSFQKTFPEDAQTELCNLNVNSGLSIKYNFENTTDVYVYREEEMFKVIAHELIHAHHVDAPDFSDHIESPVREYFGKKSKIYINESFTDTLACIMNCWCCSYIFHKGGDHYNIFFDFLKRERKYILHKGRDVMDYEGYKFTSHGMSEKHERVEKTHILSYYILKAVNFYYLDNFLHFFIDQNYHLSSQSAYVDMMMTHLRDTKVWKHLKKCAKRGTNSLRMSYIDIDPILKHAKAKVLKTLLQV
jgi:hypothetical protein